MEKREIEFNIEIYNNIIEAYLESDNTEDVWNYYFGLTKTNIEPDSFTFTLLHKSFKHLLKYDLENECLEKVLEVISNLHNNIDQYFKNSALEEIYELAVICNFKLDLGNLSVIHKYHARRPGPAAARRRWVFSTTVYIIVS